ncbi:MAG: hypothetical protein ACKVOP_12615 [Sphingomonadaceae bacterium]
MFNAVEFVHRLESEGLSRGAAEAIAQGIDDRNRDLVTKADLTELATKADLLALKADLELSLAMTRTDLEKGLATTRADLEIGLAKTRADLEKGLLTLRADLETGLVATRADFQIELAKALNRQTLQFGAMLLAAIGIAIGIARVALGAN